MMPRSRQISAKTAPTGRRRTWAAISAAVGRRARPGSAAAAGAATVGGLARVFPPDWRAGAAWLRARRRAAGRRRCGRGSARYRWCRRRAGSRGSLWRAGDPGADRGVGLGGGGWRTGHERKASIDGMAVSCQGIFSYGAVGRDAGGRVAMPFAWPPPPNPLPQGEGENFFFPLPLILTSMGLDPATTMKRRHVSIHSENALAPIPVGIAASTAIRIAREARIILSSPWPSVGSRCSLCGTLLVRQRAPWCGVRNSAPPHRFPASIPDHPDPA